MKRGVDISDEEDDMDSFKQPRTGGGGFGFSAGAMDGPSAELQLEAMLAAEGGPSFGMPGMGKGMGKGMPGKGLDLTAGLGKDPNEPHVETTPMDFSTLTRNMPSKDIQVPKELVEHLMTPEHRQILMEETGADVEWAPEDALVRLRGSQEQIKKATRLLQRVLMHCNWGRSERKVRQLLKPRFVESVICRLSPMNTLRPLEKTLNAASPILSIGKDKQNDLVISDQTVSRQHCILELDPERGAVYALDCSTNGTFLNGLRLPSKQVGKVLLSHGDELLLKDPGSGDQEYGYIVNLKELQVKCEVKLEAPRRLLTPEDMVNSGRDFA